MALDAPRLDAFRRLCELIHTPTPARLRRGRSVDWSSFPRVHEVLRDEGHGLSPELVGRRMAALLGRAYEDLAPSFPSTDAQLSSLDVFRRHLMEGESWDAITTERMEAGHPVSARTLRTRQKEALEAVLAWAAGGARSSTGHEWGVHSPARSVAEPAGGAQDAASADDSSAGSGSRTGRAAAIEGTRDANARLARVAVALAVAAVLIALLWPRDPSVFPERLPTAQIGRVFNLAPGTDRLPPPYPEVTLPDLGAPAVRALFVEDDDGRPLLALTTLRDSDHPARVVLYDPVRETVVWTRSFEPPRDRIRTHESVPEEALLEPYAPDMLRWGDHHTNLGDRIAVVWTQTWSPTFVVVHALVDGEPLGRYVHPGRLQSGAVLDLDGDGRSELLLGGQDNSYEPTRPVLVRLDPYDLHGSAGTVRWKSGPDEEDALARVVLPVVPEIMRHWEVDRLLVIALRPEDWKAPTGVLNLRVGYGWPTENRFAYQLYVGRDLRPVPTGGVVLGGREAALWDRLGIPRDRLEQLRDAIEIHGSAPAGDAAHGSTVPSEAPRAGSADH